MWKIFCVVALSHILVSEAKSRARQNILAEALRQSETSADGTFFLTRDVKELSFLLIDSACLVLSFYAI